jgi:hypothetical protein
MIDTKAVRMSLLDEAARVESLPVLSAFRTGLYYCLTARTDALFEVTDALLCADGPVWSLVELTLTSEDRRGHGGLYDALSCGRIDTDRLRAQLTVLPLFRAADGRIVLAVDVSCWLRSDAPTSIAGEDEAAGDGVYVRGVSGEAVRRPVRRRRRSRPAVRAGSAPPATEGSSGRSRMGCRV